MFPNGNPFDPAVAVVSHSVPKTATVCNRRNPGQGQLQTVLGTPCLISALLFKYQRKLDLNAMRSGCGLYDVCSMEHNLQPLQNAILPRRSEQKHKKFNYNPLVHLLQKCTSSL